MTLIRYVGSLAFTGQTIDRGQSLYDLDHTSWVKAADVDALLAPLREKVAAMDAQTKPGSTVAPWVSVEAVLEAARALCLHSSAEGSGPLFEPPEDRS